MSRKKPNNSRRTNDAKPQATQDSFANFGARLGWGTNNQSSGSSYTLSYQSRNRIWLEAAYRGSWVVGKTVDAPAEDMTRAGIEMSGIEPDDIDVIERCFNELSLWDRICDTIKWSRLYGGCIAVMLIEGQDLSTPLRPETVAKGQFKGLLVLDRWMVMPSITDLVTDYGPDIGLPKFYTALPVDIAIAGGKIHYSRVLRMEGVDLPYYQRVAENRWGLSVLEPMWDRLIAFDSASVGAGQLIYKAHLRTVKVKGLREIIAAGGPALAGLQAQMDFIRGSQTNEGMTILDGEDEFEASQYSFAGLSDMLIQFGQQLAGATGIPLTRLFGQSPVGMNSTGEGEQKQYHESIAQQQERRLRNPLHRMLGVISMSRLGKPLPDSFQFSFRSLRQMSEPEKADVADKTTSAITGALDAGLIDAPTGMKELKAASHTTGIFSNITDEQIQEAESMPPPGADGALPDLSNPGLPAKDSLFRRFIGQRQVK